MKCPDCGQYLTPSEMKVHGCRADAGADKAMSCLGCRTRLDALGIRDFRFGGMTGGVKLLLGEWAELNEETLRLEVLACPDCRRVELRLAP